MTVPQGAGRRLTSASGIIRTAGQSQAWSAPMTDMQREKAEAPFAAEPEKWWQSLLLWVAIVGAAVVVMAAFK